MPILGITTATTLTIPLGVLAVAEDLRAALLALSSVEVDGANGTPHAYAQNADYQDQPGVPMPYRAVERALLTILTEATGSDTYARHILDEAGQSDESIRFVVQEILGWRVVVTDDAGNPLPVNDERNPVERAADRRAAEADSGDSGNEPAAQTHSHPEDATRTAVIATAPTGAALKS